MEKWKHVTSQFIRALRAAREEALKEEKEEEGKDEKGEGEKKEEKKKKKKHVFEFCGVNVPTMEIFQRMSDMKLLKKKIETAGDGFISKELKNATWKNVTWTKVEDAKLLRALQKHGYDNWEAVMKDEEFGIEKVLAGSEEKVRNDTLRRRCNLVIKSLREDPAKQKPKPKKASAAKAAVEKPVAEGFNIDKEATRVIDQNVETLGKLLKAFHEKERDARKQAMEQHIPPLGDAFTKAAEGAGERKQQFLDELWRRAAVALKKEGKWEKFRDYYTKRHRGEEDADEQRPAKKKKTA
uniref:ATP-dependent helicase CHD1-2/hrp3 HTH domain-containing protein n=1 Tax=Palpitomonas bilix TaxID=652834 RepID=A0A7S3GLC3_9EUKA